MINISFTEYEEQLVIDSEVLLAKNRIIQKVHLFFGQLAEVYKEEVVNKIPGFQNLINPKISRGENYLGLPYVILDFPRQFGKADIFAIRTFFWWGNFFSITLHLGGYYQQHYAAVIQNAIDADMFSDWFVASGKTQWEHHFENSNYMPVTGLRADINTLPFLKIAKKIPLTKWDKTNSFFIENFTLLIETLLSQAPIL